MSRRLPIRHAPQRQAERGVVLMISIILVLLLTVLGLTALSLNTTQTWIATNSADAQVSFQTAEGALSQAQSSILAGNFPPENFAANGNGLYVFDPASAPLWKTIDWSSASAVIQGFQGSARAPAAYIIELLPSYIRPGQSLKKNTLVYRVTVRAVGASGAAPVMLQSTVQIQQ